jgi:hypothetical protein
MPKDPREYADLFGAKVVGEVPDVGGGPFGMARLARLMHQRLTPGAGERPGRPTDSTWESRPKVPMSPATRRRLAEIARAMSTRGRQVSPMQVAAQLLEEAVDRVQLDGDVAVEESAVDPKDTAASEEVKVGPGVKTKLQETPEVSAESAARVKKVKGRKGEQGQGQSKSRRRQNRT